MFLEIIEEHRNDFEAMKKAFAGLSLRKRYFDATPFSEVTPYPQEGTLDEIEMAYDYGLITDAQADELARILSRVNNAVGGPS